MTTVSHRLSGIEQVWGFSRPQCYATIKMRMSIAQHRPPLVGDATTRFEEHKLVILAAILLHKCYLYVALPRYSVSCFEAHNHKKAFRTK